MPRVPSFWSRSRFLSHLPALLASTALAAGLAGPGAAQDAVTEEQLREQLRSRDAVIIDLQRRFEALEQQLQEGGVLPEGVEPADVFDPAEPVIEDGQAAAAARQETLEVDELAAERALERTLVDTGALLLPAGQAEISPSVSYTHRDFRFPFVANNQVLESRVKRDEFTFGMDLLVGLPFDSQFELFLPYEVVRQDVSGLATGVPFTASDRTGSSLGDISLGLAKTVLRENGGWWPDVIVRGIWDTNTGEREDDGVALGGGFHQLRGQIVAVKRQDPLAFVGGFTYSYQFEDDEIKPGQQFQLTLGANMALSPETSLSATLNQTYTDDLEVNGQTINGSDQLATTLDVGGSMIVGARTLLRLTTSIGLTDDAPDYALRASMSYRFNTPFF